MIVGLAGRARSGKDTVANILRVERRFVQLSFAAPMRRFVANLLGCHVADLEQIKEDPHELLGGKTPRFAMQTLGTEWGRDTIAGDLWIRCCLAAARREAQCGHDVVISDVRFENEAAAIRAAGGVVWHISRPGAAKRGGPRGGAARRDDRQRRHAREAGCARALPLHEAAARVLAVPFPPVSGQSAQPRWRYAGHARTTREAPRGAPHRGLPGRCPLARRRAVHSRGVRGRQTIRHCPGCRMSGGSFHRPHLIGLAALAALAGFAGQFAPGVAVSPAMQAASAPVVFQTGAPGVSSKGSNQAKLRDLNFFRGRAGGRRTFKGVSMTVAEGKRRARKARNRQRAKGQWKRWHR
jgi:hypothetical protein